MQNCQCDYPGRIFYLKMRTDTVQLNEDIKISNISGASKQGILISSWTQFKQCDEILPSIGKNILLENIHLTSQHGLLVSEENEYTLDNFVIKNSSFKVDVLPEIGKLPNTIL
jgi:hypothetical protein